MAIRMNRSESTAYFGGSALVAGGVIALMLGVQNVFVFAALLLGGFCFMYVSLHYAKRNGVFFPTSRRK